RPARRLRVPRGHARHPGPDPRAAEAARVARRELEPADIGRLHHHAPAAGGVLLAAALLRAGPDRRGGEGVGVPSDFRPPSMEPLPPGRKWRAITIATLVLVPAFWALMVGLVAAATDDKDAADPSGMQSAGAIAFGLALIPFVFIALA